MDDTPQVKDTMLNEEEEEDDKKKGRMRSKTAGVENV